MKMGVKEFRERLSECVRGTEPVTVTHHGRVIGHYFPVLLKPADTGGVSEWANEMERRRDEWRARTPNWREMMRNAGLDPDSD